MELIRRAVERAQTGLGVRSGPVSRGALEMPLRTAVAPSIDAAELTPAKEVMLRRGTLESNRIVAHDLSNPLRKSFDILRTQVLQAMDEKDFHLLAVTSPGPGCGKTVTAINLALSIARQSQRSVLLVDMDLQRPQIANYLGVEPEHGILSVLEGRLKLPEATIQARIGSLKFSAILAEGATRDSSECMTSQAMSELLKEIRRSCRSQVVIIDLPPMLTSDDVMAILPQIDCVLFVAAVGVSSTSEIEDCVSHLKSTEVVRIVLNKASETSANYSAVGY